MRQIKPHLMVLEYAELWPWLIHAAKMSGAKIVLTNGRFHPKRLWGYQLMFFFVGNLLRKIDALLMREDVESERAISLGAVPETVFVTGNTKFDVLMGSKVPESIESLRHSLGIDAEDRVFMAGSTHEGEESIVISIYLRLLAEFPNLKLVLAPRYLERISDIANLVRAEHLSFAFRSTGNLKKAPVVLLDSMGELAKAYGLASVVFVGGSFVSRGGQNILEPAAQGKPVLFGPNMENFHDSVQALLGRGGLQAQTEDQLYELVRDLLRQPAQLIALGDMAKKAVEQISGASQRNVDAVKRLLLESRNSTQ